jgi:SecD/SecF fusion protein
MNRSHLWKFVLVVFVLVWSFSEIWPPKARNLIDQFDATAVNTANDTNYTAIINRARKFEETLGHRGSYSNLLAAIGTTDLRRYFPTNFVKIAGTRDVTRANLAILNRVQREAAGRFKLGLDLQGGTSFLLEMDTSKLGPDSLATSMNKSYYVDQAVSVLRRRVDAFGVAEPVIQPAGDNRIMVQLPGLTEADKISAREGIQKAARMEIRLADPDMMANLQSNLVPPGYEMLEEEHELEDGRGAVTRVILEKAPAASPSQPGKGLTGSYITSAYVARDPITGNPEVHFNLDAEGAQIFADITRANVGRLMGIVLDGKVVSVATISEPITGGSCRISNSGGGYSEKKAQEIATALQNPLQTPLKIQSEQGVEPSLGADSIRSGIKASIYGTLAVAGFMAVYYLRAGLVANVALLTNIIVLLGIMCSLNVTFTLPGIAGIVLTVGMAVDANVLIYERIREELAKGKSMRGALSAGYDRAFATIFDSHITTLISSVILIALGTGAIKGFGVSLTIGVAVSLFTALIVTRLIFDFLLARGWLNSLPMLHLIQSSNLKFMALAKPAFTISWLIIVIGIGYGVFVRGKDLLGVEFAGGDSVTLAFTEKVPVDEMRREIGKAGIGEVQIVYGSDFSSGRQTLRVATLRKDEKKSGKEYGEVAVETLQKSFPKAGFKQIGISQFGPSVGEEIQRSAIIASLLSLFGILVYVAFRYEFSFAVGAVVAVLHDVLMTIGCYCLTGLVGEGRQFNSTFVAALLTIIGFSINDTIVIFDRIREDLKLGTTGSFKDIINRALNETLSRTIITSGTVFLATASLYFFGGGPINDFAFTFLVGIITGTYSSIYIASALVLWWHKGQRPAIGLQPVARATAEPAGSAAR